jgi:serine/threonine protein phosphatase 1
VQFPHPLPARRRVYAVGDIHGRHDLLLDLFARIDNDVGQGGDALSTEVYLGDMVDRGPASAHVMLSLLKRARQREVVLIAGNHEIDMVAALDDAEACQNWMGHGGRSTILSFGVDPDRTRPLEAIHQEWRRVATPLVRHFCDWLLPFHVIGGFVFVHAGLRPGLSLLHQRVSDMTMIREPFLSTTWDFGYTVVHGHSPVDAIDFRHNRINVDTGAYATGRLSCVVLEGCEARIL